MKSRSLVMDGDGTLEQQVIEVPEIGPGEVLLRVDLVGVCGSDVHVREYNVDLNYPIIPGHEFVGTIEKIGENVECDAANRPVAVGDVATVSPGIKCGECWYCQNMPTRMQCNNSMIHGMRNVNEEPFLHGGMSEYFVVQEDADWYTLPEGFQRDLGALVEPLSAVIHGVERAIPPGIAHVREGFGIGQSVVVQGAGLIGLLTVATTTSLGAGQVIIVDQIDERLDMAERFGATDQIDLREYHGSDLIDRIAELTPSGEGPDVVIGAASQPEAFKQAITIPRDGGTVVEVGNYFSTGSISVDPSEIVRRHLDVYGSPGFPRGQFERSITFLERTATRFPYAELLNYRVRLDDGADAFEAQAKGNAIRAAIEPWS